MTGQRKEDVWSPEEVHTTTKMLEAGYTYSEIAAALGRSRAAIAGKVARIKGRGKGGSSPLKLNGGRRGTHDDSHYIQRWKDLLR